MSALYTWLTRDALQMQKQRRELRPVLLAPALDLDEPDRAAGAGDMGLDGRAPRFQARAGSALLVNADTVAGDEAGRAHGAKSGGNSSPGSGGCPWPARAMMSSAWAGLERAARDAK